MNELDFDIIRPYNDSETQAAITRILADNTFHQMMDYLFTPEKKELVIANIKKAKNVDDFQVAFSVFAVMAILDKTSNGVSFSGFEGIGSNKSYLYLANHRDIVLDSSIVGLSHYKNNIKSPQATWGSNLMVSQLIVDLGKSNKMITVFREGSPKELLLNSRRLSTFIRESITKFNNSVWIAQRKGRTKTGFDKTDVSILKMLILTGEPDIKSRLVDLNITPVTVSYEWEPCDAMKVRETYLSKDSTYVKSDDEDFMSILGGLTGDKGRIHLTMGTPINDEILKIDNSRLNNKQFIAKVAELTDNQIYKNYKLWPSNYLAYDLMNNSTKYKDKYNNDTVEIFEKRYKNTTEMAQDDNAEIRDLFLLLYANPVLNSLK
ncbi:MAG: acyltransferase [Bacteroidota bacterium]